MENAVDQAAIVVGRYFDLLGANRLGYALYGLAPGQRPNLAQMMFLAPAMLDLFPDWHIEAVHTAAYLRMATGDMPDDPALTDLFGELTRAPSSPASGPASPSPNAGTPPADTTTPWSGPWSSRKRA